MRLWAWRLPTCPRCCTRCGRTPGMCNRRNLWASDFLASALWSHPEKDKKTQTAMNEWHSEKALMLFFSHLGDKTSHWIRWGRKRAHTGINCRTNVTSCHYYSMWNKITMNFRENGARMKLMWSFSEVSTSSWRALWTLENFQYRWWFFRSRGSPMESKSASDADGLTVSEAAVGRIRRLANWTQGAPLCGWLMLW